tara:strand:- start:28 stop:936 length:909 start_codon:yes stop_codon:yes gene_type:complete
MPIYVGGRKISGGASSDPSSGLSEGDVYYKTDTDKLRYYNGSAWKDVFPALGTDVNNPASNADAIKAANPSATSGYYFIQTGQMKYPAQIWCDMTSGSSVTGGAGGWMRFWWHGTFEQNGNDPTSFPDGDCFGNPIEELTHTATTGFGRIPLGIQPTYLMVKTNNTQVSKNGSALRYACWQFDITNTTAASVQNSMQSNISRAYNAGDQANWQPVLNESGNTSGWPGSVGNIDYWWYDTQYQNGRGKGFNLDDDGAWGNTSIGAGRDSQGQLGVDALTYGASPAGGVDGIPRETQNLVLYWK